MKEHHWCRWPESYGTWLFCLDCGSDDYMEYAIANDYYEPFTDRWVDEKYKKEYENSLSCPVEFNKYCLQCTQARKSNDEKKGN
jgi:hypothetical protein